MEVIAQPIQEHTQLIGDIDNLSSYQKQIITDTFWDSVSKIPGSTIEKNTEEHQVEVQKTIGMSNDVLIVACKGKPITKVVYRFFSSACSDSEAESILVGFLAKQGIAPQILAQTDKYRIDQFIDSNVLKRIEIPQYSVQCAARIRAFHDLDAQLKELNSESVIESFFSEKGWILKYKNVIQPQIKDAFSSKSEAAKEYLDYFDAILENLDLVKKEICEQVITKEMIDTQVFSHNDIQENNCLIDRSEKLWLIDYEYAQVNFKANDIANYMAESQFAYDEPPAAYVYHPESKWDLHSQKFKETVDSYLNKETTEQELNQFRDQVVRCQVFQNFWWAIWSIAMIPVNDLPGSLDFVMPYAKLRFDMYFESFIENKINGGKASAFQPKAI